MTDLNNLPTLPEIKKALPPVAKTRRNKKFNATLRNGIGYARIEVLPAGKRMWSKSDFAAVAAAVADLGIDYIDYDHSAFGFQVNYLKRGHGSAI